jgi:hypothetical protein
MLTRTSWNSPLMLTRKRGLDGQYTELPGPSRHQPDQSSGQTRCRQSHTFSRSYTDFRYGPGVGLFADASATVGPDQYKLHVAQDKNAIFGLSSITTQFQAAMQDILADCTMICIIYVDDIVVFTKTSLTSRGHIRDLNKVLETLTECNLRIEIAKCHCGFTRLRVLGHVLSGTERSPDPLKLSVMAHYPTPATGKDVEHLLGFAGYLRDYIAQYAPR